MIKIKKIITAINNPKLSEELKKEKNFKVIGKDIQYKEAILEILEKNNFIDIIIISEKIPGEINLEKLIEKIKLINNKIKIIFILEKENEKLEKILIKNKIFDIYYNNKINLKELIKIINKKEVNMEEEIIKLKKIIKEKNKNDKNRKLKKAIEKIKEYSSQTKTKIKNKIEYKNKYENTNNMSTKIITFSGNNKSGKSTLSLIISQYLAEKNYKVLLIDGDLEKQDLVTILSKQKKNDIGRNLYIKRICKNLEFYYGFKNLIEKKESKKLYFKFIRKIKNNYNFIIIDLSKNNFQKLNQEILKNSNINFLIMESNILGIKEIKKLLNIYINEWKIEKRNLYLIQNKKNISSINKNLLLKIIPIKNKIFIIRENKFYDFFMNHYFKRKLLLKNKSIKKEINKIVNKIILNEKETNKEEKIKLQIIK